MTRWAALVLAGLFATGCSNAPAQRVEPPSPASAASETASSAVAPPVVGARCTEPRKSVKKRFLIRADQPDAKGRYLTGFIDETGLIVIPPTFEAAKPFSEGLAAVAVDGKWGFIDESGAIVIPPTWQEVGPFSNERAAVVFERRDIQPDYDTVVKSAFIDCVGALRVGPAWIQPPLGFELPVFRGGRAEWSPFDEKVGLDSKQTFVIDIDGAHTTDPATGFHDGFALTPRDRKKGPMKLVDQNGKALDIPAGWSPIADFSDGLARVVKEAELESRPTQTGFVDTSGKLAFSVAGVVSDFRDERAITGEPGKGPFGYVDRGGNTVIKGLQAAESFAEGYAFAVLANGDAVLLDKQGKTVRAREKGETRAPGNLFPVHFYNRSITAKGPPPIMGYKTVAGKFVYLSKGIVKEKGEAWVRANDVGPASQSQLSKP
jgi:hypothetical protein